MVDKEIQKDGGGGWKLTGFKDAQQEPYRRDGSITFGAGQAHGERAPGQHQERDPSAGPHGLEEIIRGHFEEGVGDEEYHQRDRVLVVGHAGLREKVMVSRRVQHLGISNVGTVQVAEEVDAGGQGDDSAILFADQCRVQLWVNVNRAALRELLVVRILGALLGIGDTSRG